MNERRLSERHGIRSSIFVPMAIEKRLFGSVGCSTVTRETDWSEETIALLRITGEIFASAIERSRTYRALRASEQRHRLLFERNLAGVYHNTLDGRMLDCNDALADMLGYETRRKSCSRSTRAISTSTPSERDQFVDHLRAQGGARSIEICLRRKDGRPVWLLESVHLLDEGEPILEGTLIDITDRKLAETALRDSEARYRLMAENSTDLISRTTARGVFVYASDAVRSLLGYDPPEVIGHSVFEYIVSDDDHHSCAAYTRGLELGNTPRTFSYRARRKDGSTVWFETTSRALCKLETGGIDEIVSVSRDISERRQRRGADRVSGLPRRADRPAEPAAVPRPPDHRAGARASASRRRWR